MHRNIFYSDLNVMNLYRIAVLVSTLVIAEAAISQSALPDEVRADVLRSEIIKALKVDRKGHTDYSYILSKIDEYKTLNVETPPPLLFEEAKASHENGDSMRAVRALEAFMTVADRNSPEYHQAVDIYPVFQAAAEPARQIERDKITSSSINCVGDNDSFDIDPGDNRHTYIVFHEFRLKSNLGNLKTLGTLEWTANVLNGYTSLSGVSVNIYLAAKRTHAHHDMDLVTRSALAAIGLNLRPGVFTYDTVLPFKTPAPGKYCVVVEGQSQIISADPTNNGPDFIVALKDPLVILP
jgi:hypothetical protein